MITDSVLNSPLGPVLGGLLSFTGFMLLVHVLAAPIP